MKVTGLPPAKGVGIRASLVRPGVVNNVPFDLARMRGLVGKQVSVLLRAEGGGPVLATVAVADD